MASATPGARVNLSPKGLDELRVLGPSQVVYLDYTGSGNETSAHLTAGSPLTLMVCVFEGAPMILPLYDYVGERASLITWAEAKGEDGLRAYRAEKNVRSIDGLVTGFEEAAVTD